MPRTTRSTPAPPADATAAIASGPGRGLPAEQLEATRVLVWYILDLRLHAILLESEHCVLLLGASEVGALEKALRVS